MAKIETLNFPKGLSEELKKAWEEAYSDDPVVKAKLQTRRDKETIEQSCYDFGNALRVYGVEKVMADLDEDSYWILEKWFVKGEK